MEGYPRRNLQPSRVVPWSAIALLLVAAALLALTACSSDDFSTASNEAAVADSGDTDSGDGTMNDAGAASADDFGSDMAEGFEGELADDGDSFEEGPSADPSSRLLGGATPGVVPTAADLGRQLIFTAELTVGVDDVSAAGAEATSIIEGVGGFVFGQDTVGGSQPRTTLIFKVRPQDFDDALSRLGTVGELRNQLVSTDDVTERVVDLQSRIEVAELGVQRLRSALENAGSLEDYAELERLLLERESELEVQRGMLRTLRDQVDLATITLTLTQDRIENAIALSVTHYEGFDEGRSCPAPDRFAVEQRRDLTVCIEVVNTGDQTLTDLAVTDTVLELDTAGDEGPTPIVVFGSLDELPPGQVVMLAVETEAARALNLRTRVTATPTDGADAEATGPAITARSQYQITTFPPNDPPGFGEGFEAGTTILRGVWIGIRWVLGFLIPLVVLAPLLFAIVWALRRRRAGSKPGDDRSAEVTPTVEE